MRSLCRSASFTSFYPSQHLITYSSIHTASWPNLKSQTRALILGFQSFQKDPARTETNPKPSFYSLFPSSRTLPLGTRTASPSWNLSICIIKFWYDTQTCWNMAVPGIKHRQKRFPATNARTHARTPSTIPRTALSGHEPCGDWSRSEDGKLGKGLLIITSFIVCFGTF